jgi:hypothetical protein
MMCRPFTQGRCQRLNLAGATHKQGLLDRKDGETTITTEMRKRAAALKGAKLPEKLG